MKKINNTNSLVQGSARFVGLLSIALCSATVASAAYPDALYEWTFDSDGTNTGTASGGDLSINNGASGTAAFSGGALDLSGNNRLNTSVSGHAFSDLGNVGTLNQFSVSMWVNPATMAGYKEFFVLGSSDTDIFGTENAIALRFSSTGLEIRIGPSNFSSYQDVTPVSAIAADEMTFIGITYDGSSSLAGESTIQEAATGLSGDGAYNLQVYIGTDAGIVRTGVRWGTEAAQTYNKGPVALGTDASILLGARSDNDRALDGVIDDVRIFDQVLTSAQVSEINAIPEPSSFAAILGATAFAALMVTRRKR